MSYFCLFIYFFVFKEKPFQEMVFEGEEREDDNYDDNDNVDDTNR